MTTPKVGFQGVVFKLCDSPQSLTSTLWVEMGGSGEGLGVLRGGVTSVVILVFKLSKCLTCVPSEAGCGSLGVRAAAAVAAEQRHLREALAHVRACSQRELALMGKLDESARSQTHGRFCGGLRTTARSDPVTIKILT